LGHVVEVQDIRAALLNIDEHRRASGRACESGRLAWEALTLPECPMVAVERNRPTSSIADPSYRVGADLIGNIHLINLDTSVDRLSLFHARNSDLKGVVRVSGVDGRRLDRQKLIADGIITDDFPYLAGSLGCSLSHMGLWQKSVLQNEIVTVFEDDAICIQGFREKANDFFLSKLSPDWGIVWEFDYTPKYR
jgi:hypothetical protein